MDVAAVGARVLLSLEPPPGWGVRETALELRGLQRPFPGNSSDGDNAMDGASEPLRPVLAVAAAEAADREAVQSSVVGETTAISSSSSLSPSKPPVAILRNFFAPSPTETEVEAGAGAAGPRVTLLILNTVVPEGAQAEVAAALCSFLEGKRCHIAASESAAMMEEVVAEERGGSGLILHPTTEPLATRIPAEGLTSPGGAHEETERLPVVVVAMLLQLLAPPAAPLYQHTLNGAASLDPTLPSLQSPAAAAELAAMGAPGRGPRFGSVTAFWRHSSTCWRSQALAPAASWRRNDCLSTTPAPHRFGSTWGPWWYCPRGLLQGVPVLHVQRSLLWGGVSCSASPAEAATLSLASEDRLTAPSVMPACPDFQAHTADTNGCVRMPPVI
ncbi:hypothetical protein VaNZ11_009300 [Volvox africanus]|uniref:Uncharacterized protein n=1 Tax=Volvox africanus TaxID=51714 RepID=A0ABQ5S868_9CHLO|nr:hypothetical protein VaNZ11_009300 [Volvox africanus]